MRRKKIEKIAISVISIIFVIFILLSIRKITISGNQNIEITTAEKYYGGSTLEASISVTDINTLDNLASKIKVDLLDENHKKVKNVSTTLKTEEGEIANAQLELPKDLKTGKYTLQISAKSNKGNDKVEKTISIENATKQNITVQLDKGIYKPGDDINYRVLLTSKNNDIPVQEEVEISIYDGNDNRVYIEKQKTSEFGILSGKFTLADEINSGTYKIEVSTSSQKYSKQFTVNPYVTPKFNAEITTDKENYLKGEQITITVNAKYFFGEPVKNAKVVLDINNQKQEGLTNEEGIYTYQYQGNVNDAANLNVTAQITDDSNYLVETNKTVYVSEDIFEIEVMPEYGEVIRGLENNICFFVTNPDGTSKKAYITVNMGNNITRQVITDEQGIGILNLSNADIESAIKTSKNSYSRRTNSSNYKTIYDLDLNISAQDTEQNTITKSETLDAVYNDGIIVKTDKVKYNQEDDIKITLNSDTEIKDKTLAVCKNGDILKLITTNDQELAINLGDTYGLIDIYTLGDTSDNTSKKRTIFIKPNKKLNIDLQTNSTEYQPKDNMNLTVNLTDENGKTIDGALLVSILDEAQLKLKDNDLSIDNIKMALSDIKFSDELDAATLYANIIDDKQESSLMAILLKQDGTSANISKKKYVSWQQKEIGKMQIVFAIIIFLVIILIYCFIKFEILRKILKHVIAFLGITALSCLIFGPLAYEILDVYEEGAIIISALIALIAYIAILYKYKEPISRMSIHYILYGIIFSIIITILNFFDIYDFKEQLFAILIVPLIVLIILCISLILKQKNIKKDLMGKIKNICLENIKTVIIIALTFLAGESSDSYVFALIIFILLNILAEIKFHKSSYINGKGKKIDSKNIGIGIIVGVIITVLIGIIGANSNNNGILTKAGAAADDMATMEGDHSSTTNDDGRVILTPNDIVPDSTQATEKIQDSAVSDFASSIEDLFTNKNDSLSNVEENIEIAETETETNELQEPKEETNIEEENIRSVFLESLCFIPELITKNGQSQTNLTLSDNITTWKIQVVGNTKSGNIGYSTSNITVKKDFFADFSLPTNCIVGDEIQIPVTIYNYTENVLDVSLEIPTDQTWFTISRDYEKTFNVNSNATKLVYIPITINTAGENTFKAKATANGIEDIIQKNMTVKNKGLEVTKVVSSGTTENEITQDIIYNDEAIDGTKNLKVKLYPGTVSQVVEGLENIFRMPTGCFEQVSSSLYPDIMALKYMEENNIVDNEIKEKALSYISSGYQKILTYEVKGEKGGYSLFGRSPANPILTAYGLMELSDLATVYEIDSNVTNNMKEYLYSKQKLNGAFEIGNSYSSETLELNDDELTINAYIIWALSETDAQETRLNKSIKYLENNLDKLDDAYSISLAANIFANINKKDVANTLIERALKKMQIDDDVSYIKSDIIDYYGTRGRLQNLQATALTSMAMSKTDLNKKTNQKFIDYIISCKDSRGTWQNTQATILSLKALVEFSPKSDITDQTITVDLNGETKEIEVKKDSLDLYELKFENVGLENKLKINMKKGKIYYEIVEEYYQEAEKLKENSSNQIEISATMPQNCKVNDLITQTIEVKNVSQAQIKNGMVEITIPQGFTVDESSLSKMVVDQKIEKYEYNYTKIYLYVQDLENQEELKLDITYRANYPGKITGGAIRAYDYYNPEVEGICVPQKIEIT